MTADDLPENVRLTLLLIIDTADRGAAYHGTSPHEDIGYKTGALTNVADLAKSLLAHPGQPAGVHATASRDAATRRRALHTGTPA